MEYRYIVPFFLCWYWNYTLSNLKDLDIHIYFVLSLLYRTFVIKKGVRKASQSPVVYKIHWGIIPPFQKSLQTYFPLFLFILDLVNRESFHPGDWPSGRWRSRKCFFGKLLFGKIAFGDRDRKIWIDQGVVHSAFFSPVNIEITLYTLKDLDVYISYSSCIPNWRRWGGGLWITRGVNLRNSL